MQFEHEVQEKTFGQVQEYLGELFEDPFLDEDSGHFYVSYGSTVLEIAVEPYGPEEASVVVMAYCVQGVELEEDLLLGLLEINHVHPFATFSLVERDIFVHHSIFGRCLDRRNLLGGIAAVATTSDDYDDRIVARYGGQTALDRIRSTGGRKKRGEKTSRTEN